MGHTGIVTSLLERGAPVNHASKRDGLTPLMLAADSGYAQTVEALLAGSADVNARDHKGSTALIKAASQGHVAVAEMLLGKCADLGVENGFQWNALRLAAAKGQLEMVRLLLRHGAAVNQQGEHGMCLNVQLKRDKPGLFNVSGCQSRLYGKVSSGETALHCPRSLCQIKPTHAAGAADDFQP
jgi:ankyrin repeat protein